MSPTASRRTGHDGRAVPGTAASFTAPAGTPHARVAVIGAGFAGLGTAIALRKRGIGTVVFERADEVGGTWRDNTYPGCQCDVPSSLYSFSFAPNPDWTRTYPTQPELGAYLRRCAEESGVLPDIRFGHTVVDASWDAATARWAVQTTGGTWTADILVVANGPLAEPAIPELPGLDTFEGTTFHSAAWDHQHDLSGERVAVVGTGASAVQIVPGIQPVASRLLLFQRTPPWVLPHPDRPTRTAERALYRMFPPAQRLARAGVYWSRELLVLGMVKRPPLMRLLEGIARAHLRRHVPDPVLRAKLTPAYAAGCKRLLLSNRYFPAVGQPNVDVITEPIAEVRPRGIATADGTEHPVDTIVLATGFRVTDNPTFERLHGTTGRSLAQTWAEDGLRAYLGSTVPGFPNMFVMAGPNTGIGHTSLLVMIEAQIHYLLGAIETLDRTGAKAFDVLPEPFAAYNESLQRSMAGTVWLTGGCASWYLDAEGRNTTLWPDWTWRFWMRTRHFDLAAYQQIFSAVAAGDLSTDDSVAGPPPAMATNGA